jgi:hemoglobin-like flavoprotein
MTPEQKELVRETWKQVAPTAEEAADLFYCRLFDIDPGTRELFHASDMFAQRKKLLQTLGFAISSLDNLDVLMPIVQDLGRRHIGYGVTAKQYESVGVALLWRWSAASVLDGRRPRPRHGPRSTHYCRA